MAFSNFDVLIKKKRVTYKTIYEKTFPNYLKLTFKNRNERLRKIKNAKFKLLTRKYNTFHGSVSSIFNELSKNIRSEMTFRIFSKLIKQYPLDLITIFLSDVHHSILFLLWSNNNFLMKSLSWKILFWFINIYNFNSNISINSGVYF